MSQAKNGDTVKVHYTGKLEDGTVFDSSLERDPLSFQIGSGQVIPGFENTVIGMTEGDSRSILINSDEAYGPYQDDQVLDIEKSNLPDHIQPEVGMILESVQDDGQTIRFTVIGVSDSQIKLDANHPLAGKNLNFEIQLVEIV